MTVLQFPVFWVTVGSVALLWVVAFVAAFTRRRAVPWYLLLAVVATAVVGVLWVPTILGQYQEEVLASVPTVTQYGGKPEVVGAEVISADFVSGANPRWKVVVATPEPRVVERMVEKQVAVLGNQPVVTGGEVLTVTQATDPLRWEITVQPEMVHVMEVVTKEIPAATFKVVLAEVDQSTKVEQTGLGYRNVQFATDPGQVASTALVFGAAGDLVDVRVVCDDTCTRIYLLNAEDGSVIELKPSKVYGPKFDYTKLSSGDSETAQRLGVNVKDSEILAQNLLLGPYKITVGDQLVIYGADDPTLGVNRGIFASWNLK